MKSAEVVERHRARGRDFEAAGVASFVLDEGEGEAVVCVHGVPTSSFLWRKVLPELAAHGLRGVAFDLPGQGLAARPRDFDYSWSGLGRFATAAVGALGLERFHLVVHDIGGPVGFELAAAVPERVASLTVLNTMVAVDEFRRPPVMEPLARRGLGEVYLRTWNKPAFRLGMGRIGVADRSRVTGAELDAYVDLMRRGDGGRALLAIMRGFERTAAKRALYEGVLRAGGRPVQVVWGAHDPVLTLREHGEIARRAAGVEEIHTVPGRHFLQEDQAPAIAAHVARLARSLRSP